MLCKLEEGFSRIGDEIPDAIIDLRYFSQDNFVGKKVYDKVYDVLRTSTLTKLAMAANVLREKGYRLVIWDAYRPIEVQKIFWDLVGDPNFVAHPDKGSKHNWGYAVDVSLASMEGIQLEMPSAFDDFSQAARGDRQDIPREIKVRLKDLQCAMKEAGFMPYEKEWWHFTSQ